MRPLLRVPLMPLVEGPLVLPEATGRYVTRVRRLIVGDTFIGFDPEARSEAAVVVLEVGRHVRCVVTALRVASVVSGNDVTLLQAMGKGDKPDQIVRDATALGVTRVVLLYSARSVPRDSDRGDAKQKRLRTIAVEAARQSGRGDVPDIVGPLPFDDALATVTMGLRVCLAPGASEPLVTLLEKWQPGVPLPILVGPEGGFDRAELEAARANDFVAASFGDFVLRTETAAVAVLGAVTALRPSR